VPGWEDVRALALALPEVGERTSRGHPAWRVRDRLFVWQRPLRRADLVHLGDRAPDAPPLGAWVPDLGAKEALLADDPDTYLTTRHFAGHPIVLVRLDRIDARELEELITEAWLARAPRRLARAWLDDALLAG
jgi:hypothetical protein